MVKVPCVATQMLVFHKSGEVLLCRRERGAFPDQSAKGVGSNEQEEKFV